MFREDLEDLKNLYLGRFSVIHVLEMEGQEIDLFTGRVDAEKMKALFERWIDPKSVDTAFICGPEPMMLAIAASLRDHGLTDAQIKFELFASGQPGRAKARPVSRARHAEAKAATRGDGDTGRCHPQLRDAAPGPIAFWMPRSRPISTRPMPARPGCVRPAAAR